MPAFPLNNFGGIHQRRTIQPNVVRRSTNILFEDGRAIGRAGIEKLLSITTPLNAGIIGFAELRLPTSNVVTILAFTTTKAYSLNTLTNAWDDITGSALTAGIYNNISWTLHKDVLIFTNGVDAVRRWTGSGNTAAIAGTPPDTAQLVKHFEGYLFLGDVTLSATRYPSRIRYSDDYNVTWASTNEINLTETAGGLKAWDTIGRTLYCYKSDGIVGIRLLGGQVRFSQFKIPFYDGIGIIAPLSLTSIPGVGHVFLGTDINLYLNNNESIQLMGNNVQDALQEIPTGWIQQSAGILEPKSHKWSLFISSGDSWLNRRIIWDYKDNRWSVFDYTTTNFARVFASINRASSDIWTGDSQIWSADSDDWSRSAVSDNQLLIGGGDDELVYRFDTGTLDDTDFVKREWETDWQDFGSRTRKICYGVDLVFERAIGTEVYISIAADFKGGFKQEKVFSLTGDEYSDDVICPYRITPLSGVMFNIRLAYRHTRFTSSAPELTTLKEMFFFYDQAIKGEESRPPLWAV